MRIAVIGCSHGTLDDIYASVERCHEEAKAKGEPGIDLMICCGDFQAMRSHPDLLAMACPPKYRALGHFHHYYSERKKAPFLTIVIGGNHESSGYMWECYHGGWLAPDIYFLGFAGCVLVDGWLRIGGASGIFKQPDFTKGHYEKVPYDDRTIRSVYHIRQYDVARLLQLKAADAPPVDIFLSHDWPLGIEQYGDTGALIREKPFFKQEIEDNRLGSPPLHALLQTLQPRYWFSAHLHVKFAALVKHDGGATVVRGRRGGGGAGGGQKQRQPLGNPDEIVLEEEEDEEPPTPAPEGGNPDEIALEDDVEEEELEGRGVISEEKGCAEGCGAHGGAGGNPEEIDVEMEDDVEEEEAEVSEALLGAGKSEEGRKEVEVPTPAPSEERTTRFLALSKPGHGKDFLQIVDIPTPAAHVSSPSPTKPELHFDPHWLAIMKTFAPHLSLSPRQNDFPPLAQFEGLIKESLAWVRENVGDGGRVKVGEVQKFARTAPAAGEVGGEVGAPPSWYTNPQTEALCELLAMPNQINPMPAGFKEAQKAAVEQEEERRKVELKRAREEALREVDAVEVREGEGEALDEEPRGEKVGE